MKSQIVDTAVDYLSYIPWRKIIGSTLRIIPTDSLQYVWVFSHMITLLGAVLYTLFLLNPENMFLMSLPWYTISLIGSVMTYSLVVYRRHILDPELMSPAVSPSHSYKSNQLDYPTVPLTEILKSENTHLLVYSCLWLSTPANLLKIFPFAAYSFLNLTNYYIVEAFPAHHFSMAITPLVAYIEYPLLLISAHVDLAVIGLLCKEAKDVGSIYVLIFYIFVWGLRVEYSDASRIAVANLLKFLDKVFSEELLPSAIYGCWVTARNRFTLMLSITDYNTFVLKGNEEGSEVKESSMGNPPVPNFTRSKERKVEKKKSRKKAK